MWSKRPHTATRDGAGQGRLELATWVFGLGRLPRGYRFAPGNFLAARAERAGQGRLELATWGFGLGRLPRGYRFAPGNFLAARAESKKEGPIRSSSVDVHRHAGSHMVLAQLNVYFGPLGAWDSLQLYTSAERPESRRTARGAHLVPGARSPHVWVCDRTPRRRTREMRGRR